MASPTKDERPRNADSRVDMRSDLPAGVTSAPPVRSSGDAGLSGPIPVSVVGSVATTTDAVQQAAYVTFVIPASTAGGPVSVQKLMPYDILRQYAYVYSADAPIVVANSQQAAQAPSNGVASGANPSGAYLPNGIWMPPVRHNEELWAANTSTTVSTRVTVLVERSIA